MRGFFIFIRTLSRNWRNIFCYYSPAGILWPQLAHSVPHWNSFNGVHGYN